jgi:CubicO group peptidase (beta-lactamase class C family)
MKRLSTMWVALPLALLLGCGGGGGGKGVDSASNEGGDRATVDGGVAPDRPPGAKAMTTVAPPETGDGWHVSTPAAEHMDQGALLASLDHLLVHGSGGIDAVVVVRNDRLVAEAYYNGYDRDTLHDVRSVTKSITSALTGIAIDRGIVGLDDTIAQHIPDFESYPGIDARKRAIRIHDLVNMRTGMSCDDMNVDSPGNERYMYGKADWVRFALGIPMSHEPGVTMSYCSAGVMLLGHIIAARAGVKLEDFAAARLFGPLGITKVGWVHSSLGITNANSAFQIRARDAAKFGSLYLNAGTWEGASVVPADWIERSHTSTTSFSEGRGYGWLWWKSRFVVRGSPQDGIFASGNGGNLIFVLPRERLVAVINASNYNRGGPSEDFFRNGILAAVLQQ